MTAKSKTPPPESSTPGCDETSRSEAETALLRLAAEACLVEELLTDIEDRHNEARGRIERLEQRLAGMGDAARVEDAPQVAAEAAVIESRLTRLRVAAGLAARFAGLRAGEAGNLITEGRRSRGNGAAEAAAGNEETQRSGRVKEGGAVGGAA